MNKKILILVVVLLLVGLGALAWRNHQTKTSSQSGDKKTAQVTYKSTKACDLLTLDDAKKVIGNSAASVAADKAPNSDSTDQKVSICSYRSQEANAHSVTVSVVSPLTTKGLEANKANIKTLSKTATAVEGYTETYWSDSAHELTIFKDGELIIIATRTVTTTSKTQIKEGASLKSTAGNLEDAKKVADLVKTKI